MRLQNHLKEQIIANIRKPFAELQSSKRPLVSVLRAFSYQSGSVRNPARRPV